MKTVAPGTGHHILGILVMLVGAVILALGAGVFPSALRGANAPLWVILAIGGIFFIAGLLLVTQHSAPESIRGFLAGLLITLFALVPGWIAWGDGPRSFTTSFGFASGSFAISDVSFGRIVFSFAALLTSLMALFYWIPWINKLSRTERIILLVSAPLAAYLILIVMPAEPNWPDLKDDHERLSRYALLSEDEGWLRNKGRGPLHWYFPPWRNIPQWTMSARSRLTAQRSAPSGQAVLDIPRIASAPVVDGRIGENEWQGALSLALEPESLGSTVLIARAGDSLYLAADVPADTTETGYDQFHFWFHIGLSPWLDNERAFVDRSGGINVMRATRFPWGKNPVRERTDWHVYHLAQGASGLVGHRRFELKLDLEESAIHPGIPFPAWINIEGDPLLNAAGKFKARSSMGRSGHHKEPLWFRVTPP